MIDAPTTGAIKQKGDEKPERENRQCVKRVHAVQQSARTAQQRCHEFMHEDADEYVSCLNALLKQVKGKDVKATQQRLGISYFAWIGANNAARLGLAGSEQAAKTYLPQFRLWQKQLNVSDDALCTTVVGECAPRVAQMRQLEKELQEESKEHRKEHPASHPNQAAQPHKAAAKSASKNPTSISAPNN